MTLLAFVSIFCAALFPAVHSATDAARATAVKNKVRGIWIAITSANTEREINDLSPLWPGDLAKAGITFTTSEEYFTYLMSDGFNTKVIAPNIDDRLVWDLAPGMLTAHGLKPATPGGPVLPENNAWHVANIFDMSPAEVPFIVTRNAKASALAYPTQAELDNRDVLIPLNAQTKPFGNTRVVWVSKGGATMESRALHAFRAFICPLVKPDNAPALTVLPSEGGFK